MLASLSRRLPVSNIRVGEGEERAVLLLVLKIASEIREEIEL